MSTATTNLNGIDTEALQATMAAVKADPSKGIARFQVTTDWKGGPRSETRVEGWELGGERIPKDFTIQIDEPFELLGTNTAPNPQEYLLAGMNACLLATYVAACAAQGIELEQASIESKGELDLRGFLGIDGNVKPGYDSIDYTIRVKGDGTKEQFERVHRWMQKTSPNYWNMAQPVELKPTLVVE